MAGRWHITDKGEVKKCTAATKCPYMQISNDFGIANHFNKQEDAEVFSRILVGRRNAQWSYENMLKEETHNYGTHHYNSDVEGMQQLSKDLDARVGSTAKLASGTWYIQTDMYDEPLLFRRIAGPTPEEIEYYNREVMIDLDDLHQRGNYDDYDYISGHIVYYDDARQKAMAKRRNPHMTRTVWRIGIPNGRGKYSLLAQFKLADNDENIKKAYYGFTGGELDAFLDSQQEKQDKFVMETVQLIEDNISWKRANNSPHESKRGRDRWTDKPFGNSNLVESSSSGFNAKVLERIYFNGYDGPDSTVSISDTDTETGASYRLDMDKDNNWTVTTTDRSGAVRTDPVTSPEQGREILKKFTEENYGEGKSEFRTEWGFDVLKTAFRYCLPGSKFFNLAKSQPQVDNAMKIKEEMQARQKEAKLYKKPGLISKLFG